MNRLFLQRITFVVLCLFSISAFAAKQVTTTEKEKGIQQEENPKVLIKTEYGDVILELFPSKAPITVKNFLGYVDRGFYDGTIFHRVLPGFVVQGGGFRFNLSRKETEAPIVNESANKLKNLKGTISMARLADPDSATSQFFINLADNPHLDPKSSKEPGYTVFGKVIQGFEHIQKLEKEPQGLFRDPRFTNTPNIKPMIVRAKRLQPQAKESPKT